LKENDKIKKEREEKIFIQGCKKYTKKLNKLKNKKG
jgi:hypothetical protein